ncbi:MAG: SUMF1/EgtB/PvdO family nonheme iron enzyme [Phycisphaerae bacterium]|nr:SUMF1/EgtB/PvdO family nonheme iron enzyme [Phycisphaerae bacterium]
MVFLGAHRMRFSMTLWVLLVAALITPARTDEVKPSGALDACLKKATWAETMVAARGVLLSRKSGPAFKPFVSEVLRGGQDPQRVSVDVTGLGELWLVATVGPDNYNWDQAIWGEPVVIDKQGKQVRLVDLKPASVKVGYGKLILNKDHAGKPLQIGKKVFEHGFWAHAASELCFRLNGEYVRFEAWVGIGVLAGKNGSVQFKVCDEVDSARRLWGRIERDFPTQAKRMVQDLPGDGHLTWFGKAGSVELEGGLIGKAVEEIGPGAEALRKELAALRGGKVPAEDPRWLALYDRAAEARERYRRARALMQKANLESVRLAVEDLIGTFPDRYTKGQEYLRRIEACEKRLPAIRRMLEGGQDEGLRQIDAVFALKQEALLANPLLDFETLLLVRRSEKSPRLGLPQNWQGNCVLPRDGYDNVIATLSPVRPDGKLSDLYRPEKRVFVGDLDLHFEADKLLFSMIGSHNRWQIWEIGIDGAGLRQVTRGEEDDVDNYDACYLPDGRILFGSTATMVGVPCVYGSTYVANFYRMDADGSNVRQLCFDQDHNWCPEVLPNGRVMYLRWEYTDTPHSNTRILFHMNPDGTSQMAFYGTNSYWPNGVFFARPIPGHPTKAVGIVTGHHGVPRMGELIVFDTAKGREEVQGAVQRIPERGKPVRRVVADRLVDDSWPKFLHPYPLSERYFLVSCKPTPDALWGIYLVDVFDNMLLIKEQPGEVLFEPVPARRRARPPVIPDKVDLARKDAVVYLSDVYAGGGLDGIPRGTVKQLRLFTYTYAYRNMGGLLGVIGMDGPWDIKRVLGTVPVEADGSASFRVPANTPISVQPLDGEGKALQLMRSWFTAMPGEVLSCVGCHERQNTAPPVRQTLAMAKAPAEIASWHGPSRGFSFQREVQPVLDRYCVTCHDGKAMPGGKAKPDLRGAERIKDWRSVCPGNGGGTGKAGQFSVAYAELHRFVRRPGIESDYHLLSPMEYHADATELVQMLVKGHHGVRLDGEGWDRLITWIDLNTPYHGTWSEIEDGKKVRALADRSRALRRRYAGVDVDYEAIPETPKYDATPVAPAPEAEDAVAAPPCPGWPFDGAEAKRRQGAAGAETRRAVDLGGGVTMAMALIPAGSFVMGDAAGHRDERPLTRVDVGRPFWMGTIEVTNEQFARFDSKHDSRMESKRFYQFGVHGHPVNGPKQPVVRVSWLEAAAFCEWLSKQTGQRFGLPTEAQWEYACRAGSDGAFSYGTVDSDFSKHANLSDAKIHLLADNPYLLAVPLKNPSKYDDWVPRDGRFDDGAYVSRDAGGYRPNAWGVYDMHGNVAEWTRSAHAAYPYREDDGRNDAAARGRRVVRGGSWYDRPKRARSGFRLAYQPYQRVFSVGFRVVCEADPARVAAK